MKILIVDDHAIMRRTMRAMLDKSVTVLEAENGFAGYESLQANPDVSIILADFNMPKLNGLQMLEKIRQDIPNAKPKVIFISSERDPALLAKAKALGVSGWLFKPFKKEELAAALNQISL